jgi:hypothetical protein
VAKIGLTDSASIQARYLLPLDKLTEPLQLFAVRPGGQQQCVHLFKVDVAARFQFYRQTRSRLAVDSSRQRQLCTEQPLEL